MTNTSATGETLLWRAMTPADLDQVQTIAKVVHPGFFERPEVFSERQQLYPAGTKVLELYGALSGYVLSHPWQYGTLPSLDSLLGSIPPAADTYYLHDLALLSSARGTGAAGVIVRTLIDHAKAAGFASASLVAVNKSQAFWEKQGFEIIDLPSLTAKLASYEDAARFMVKRLD